MDSISVNQLTDGVDYNFTPGGVAVQATEMMLKRYDEFLELNHQSHVNV
ncbi:MAG: hypothetical protein ACYC7D_04365 [Nitrososphaerales archaeon]